VALALLALLAPLAAACSSSNAAAPALPLDKPLPTSVPKGTTIVVGDPVTQVALQLSGELKKFTYPVKFANISGGPQTMEAFRANALDVGSVADIPPIFATWTGLHVHIVAAKFRKDPVHHPIYQLGVAPGVDVKTLADLKGKKIAYSPGQAQGALVLRVLKKEGLTKDDVQLVEIPSTEDVYNNALASHQVDVAPLGGVYIKRYLADYGKDGATVLDHGLRDDASFLYVQDSSLEDPAKAAAIREYVQHWAVAQQWIYTHPSEWLKGYYEDNQGLSATDGAWLIRNSGTPEIPTSWDTAIAAHQQTIDLLAQEEDQPPIKAADLWDRRFEKLGGRAFAAAGGGR
jgi:sulfonate transport system substrate-binding protein